MGEVSWIKFDVNFFDNRKIRKIRRQDDGDQMVIVWIYLLTLAAKCNDGGRVSLSEDTPYTVEDLADDIGYVEEFVGDALDIFKKLNMIDVEDDGTIWISSWEDHQNIEAMERKKENARERQQRHRDKVAQEKSVTRDVTCDMSHDVTNENCDSHALDKIREDKSRSDKTREEGDSDAGKKPAPSRHRYGTYNRVLLSDDDLTKLKAEFSADWQERIDRLDEYIEIHGDKYKNHLATIRAWARKDKENGNIRKPAAGPAGTTGAANEWAYLDNLI